MNDIAVNINGKSRPLAETPVHTTALDWLRESGLSGSKEGCAEGECGACAMLLATPTADGGTAWTPVNACLVPAYALNGQEIITAEGLGDPDALHPVQEKLAEAGGSQCGYCTPGFACSMAGEYYRSGRASGAADGTPTLRQAQGAAATQAQGAGATQAQGAGADGDRSIGSQHEASCPTHDAEHGPN